MDDRPNRFQPQQKPRRRGLPDMVFERLLRAIKSGAYAENERLPTEHALAAELNVSRPVVREALKRLRDQGLIFSRRGAGSFVRRPGLRQPLGFGPLENFSGLDQCYEFRLSLEPDIAATAALRCDGDSLSGIASALDLMRDATRRGRHREDADFAFHFAIALASGNQYFTTAMEALEDHIAIGMQFHGVTVKETPGGLEDVFGEHTGIFEAIRDRDPEQARSLMRAHLAGCRERLFKGRRMALSTSELTPADEAD